MEQGDPFLQYANSLLQDQILFGTDWPIILSTGQSKELMKRLQRGCQVKNSL
jgi:predicted TIM-barrel fold metal-dependent hydrolase